MCSRISCVRGSVTAARYSLRSWSWEEHQPRLHEAYKAIYTQFYDSLSSLLTELNPDASREWLSLKVRLATCLMDGSAIQPLVAGQDQKEQEELMAALGDEVLRIVGCEESKPNR